MEKKYIIFASANIAFKAERILNHENLNVKYSKYYSNMSTKGCEHSIMVDYRLLDMSLSLLRNYNISVVAVR